MAAALRLSPAKAHLPAPRGWGLGGSILAQKGASLPDKQRQAAQVRLTKGGIPIKTTLCKTLRAAA